MGCCLSSRGPSSLYREGPSHSSSRAINSSHRQSQAALPRPSTYASDENIETLQAPIPRLPSPAQLLSRHINRPLRLHIWATKGRSWTEPELEQERAAFFDTRVTGRPEIWQALRVALEILWSGGDDMDSDGGLATAQQILTAAEITVPSGDLANGVYDRFGAYYALPEYIVSDPVDMLDTAGLKAAHEAGSSADSKDAPVPGEDQEVKPEDKITLKARRSDGVVKDIVITTSKKEPIQTLSIKFAEAGNVQPARRLKLAYMGRLLRATESLETTGWEDGHVLNALIFD